tara:strand:+ start:167 stop:670 length:504 start_codon:yes stop_codon:yes gene_type:complete
MSTLSNLIRNFYRIKNNNINLEKYTKLLKLYNSIKMNNEQYVNQMEWNKLYRYSKDFLPESPPLKQSILNDISSMLQINYLDMIYKFYMFIDTTNSLKNLTSNLIEELKFINFIISKNNTNFIINQNSWNSIRSKCLVNKTKTKMPREPIRLSQIIININNIIALNN